MKENHSFTKLLDKNELFENDTLTPYLDMAAKRRKKHKNKISGLVISMCYNEQ
jgi:hypothetical protein